MHVALLLSLPLLAVRAEPSFPKRFVIDLALPPEERWREVVAAHRDVLPAMLVGMEMQLWEPAIPGEDGEHGTAARAPPESAAWWLRHHNLGPELLAELVGIARLADHPEVTLRRLILFQVYLEATGQEAQVSGLETVGVVACNANGTVFHGRNIAYNFHFIARGRRMKLGELAMDLTWVRAGRPLFSGLGFPGRLGVLSGTVLDGAEPLSITVFPTANVDQRVTDQAATLKLQGVLPQLAVREALLANLGYKATVLQLERRPLVFPSSFLISGRASCAGALIQALEPAKSGDDTAPEDITHSGVITLDPKLGLWYLTLSYELDVWADPVAKVLNTLGREQLTASSLLSALRSAPLLPAGAALSVTGAAGEDHLMLSAFDAPRKEALSLGIWSAP